MAKIIAVDDDPAGQRLIKYMLTAAGHEVITASNGIQGLQMVNQQAPDLVILDVMLPGIDGFEVCRRLRAGSATKSMPVIMLSGKTQASDRDTALKMGANEYLVKPVERLKLLDTVSGLLDKRKESSVKKAVTYAFIGARGGAGTSTVVLNTAAALTKLGKSTILVDMTPSYSSIGEMIGLNANKSIAGLFKNASGTLDTNKLKGLFEQHHSGITLLWGETNPDETTAYNTGDVKTLFKELGGMADYLIADIPSSPSENAITALTLADMVILISGSGKESLEKISNSILRLTRFGINPDKVNVVVVDKSGSGTIEEISNEKKVSGFKLAGIIHYCADECAKAESAGIPVVLHAPDSLITKDINTLVSRIIQP